MSPSARVPTMEAEPDLRFGRSGVSATCHQRCSVVPTVCGAFEGAVVVQGGGRERSSFLRGPVSGTRLEVEGDW